MELCLKSYFLSSKLIAACAFVKNLKGKEEHDRRQQQPPWPSALARPSTLGPSQSAGGLRPLTLSRPLLSIFEMKMLEHMFVMVLCKAQNTVQQHCRHHNHSHTGLALASPFQHL